MCVTGFQISDNCSEDHDHDDHDHDDHDHDDHEHDDHDYDDHDYDHAHECEEDTTASLVEAVFNKLGVAEGETMSVKGE